MSFTGKENCTTTLANASTLNAAFRSAFPTQPLGIYFSIKTLQDVLAQAGCVGIRFYFAMDDQDQLTLTFAGVTSNENDILGIIGDSGIRCPTACSAANALNS